ncbi:MAG: adenylate cyclase [Bacteroidia bacterium]|jgi:adenylate cyclase
MLKIVLTLLLCVATIATKAQTNLDSLYGIWQDETQPDTNRVKAYKDYIWDGFLYSKPDSATLLMQNLLKFGEQNQNGRAKSLAYNLMGVSSWLKSNYPEALGYYQRSLNISQEIGFKRGSASTSTNIGIIYSQQGDYPKALDYYRRSLKIYKEIGDKKGGGNTLNNIGIIYKQHGDYRKALEYFQRSLKIFEEIGNKQGTSSIIGNIGLVYMLQDNYPDALDYYKRSLKISEDLGYNKGCAIAISNIGNVYDRQGDKSTALIYFRRALKIRQELGDKQGSANAITNIGNIHKDQGQYAKALTNCKNALKISLEIEALVEEKNACQCLYDTYKTLGKGNEALIYLEKINVIDDSLHAEETNKNLQKMEFAKAMLADSVKQVEEKRRLNEEHEDEVQKKNKTRNILTGGGILLLIIAGGLYGRNRYIRKSKDIIENERDRSDNLLLNILPADIAAELKANGKAEARDFDNVSMLFTDFKGFTSMSENMSAQDLVANINHCFEAFDGIMHKYGIEKIKTIGDAYMAAGGLPVQTDDSVKNTVLAALEMQDFITRLHLEKEAKGEHAFQMRCGIHTGPVVAGIVGVKKIQYDIWGDTVNTAARMESSGAIEKVNISQATYELLKNDSQFAFESRGKIEAKGKGEIEMYFVSLKK